MIRSMSSTDPIPRSCTHRCNRVRITTLSAFVFGALLAGCGGSTATSGTTTTVAENPIMVAAEACDARTSLRDKGDTIVLDTEGDEEIGGDPYHKVECVIAQLEMPDRVLEAINNTRALDGVLEDSWDGLNARWSFHPDTGLNLTIWNDE